jgi:hypothetical protein
MLDEEEVVFELDIDDLTDDELEMLASQALDRCGDPLERGRLPIGSIFALVYGIALHKLEDRQTGENRFSRGFAPVDETAPLSHQATDVAYALALTLPLVENPASPPRVRGVWNQLATSLRREVERRGPPA